MMENVLYYGDNLDILQRYIKDETIDLIYLDPPFKSEQDYNVLFAERNGSRSAAQIKAFEDTWQWDEASAKTYHEVVESGPEKVSQVMQAFNIFIGGSDMLAYLSMMAPRLVELHRVLKETGSIYLHCDPTASHYLKMLMDAVFLPVNFKNEIVWKRTSGHSDARRFGNTHDVLLFYSKGQKYVWNKIYQKYDEEYVKTYYRYADPDGRKWMSDNLSARGLSGGGYEYEWKGVKGLWRCPKETMAKYDREGKLYYTKNGIPRLKRYLDKAKGLPGQDVWIDIEALRSWHKERLGYQTQKPEALLERMIEVSSNEGDVVLDPFCGCGTAIAAAHKLKRRWIGIDITHLAIGLVKHRLKHAFGDKVEYTYEVIQEPKDLAGAKQLAKDDPFQFECWALGLVGARPAEKKRGPDEGIDGRLYFHDEAGTKAKTKQIIISVKSGEKVTVSQLRDLRGVIEREDAKIGVLISLAKPTRDMHKEAANAGFYKSAWGKHPRLQLLTIEELLGGKKIDYPPSEQVNVTLKRAPKAKSKEEKHPELNYPEE